tara:strand:+ start:124 stop:606 length:483 start_codon:yes stop_codon:yes gene_type:complete
MATYKFPKGTIDIVKTVEVDAAFVTNSYVEAELTQPANTILKEVALVVVSEPTIAVHANSDLGFKIGTDTSTTIADGADDLAEDLDGLINAAANTTALKTGAVFTPYSFTANSAGTTSAANAAFSSVDRTLYFNTLATTDAAVSVGGKVRWVCSFSIVGG